MKPIGERINMGLRTLERLNRLVSENDLFFNKHELAESIANHVEKLLNTKLGSVPSDPDYGQDTKSWLDSNSSVESLQRQMANLTEYLKTKDNRIAHCHVSLLDSNNARCLIRFKLEVKTDMQTQLQLFCEFLSDETFVVSQTSL